MSTLREAAQAALEALEDPDNLGRYEAIDALRAALAAEPERVQRIMALADEMVAAAAREGYMPGGFDAARAALLAELEGKA